MIDATRAPPEGRQIIQSYGEGGFTVSGVALRGSILILPDRTVPWPVGSAALLGPESLVALRTAEPAVELLILGMGPAFVPVPSQLRVELKGWGIAAEGMATPAACRTYNLLATEGRRGAAPLIAA